MLVMNGYEATEYIKSQLKSQATYIVALTASIFAEKAIVSANCDDFVCKPFPEAILFHKIAQYLEVNYVYAENTELETIKAYFILELTALGIMLSEWLIQLQQAVANLDKVVLAELFEQIPNRHSLRLQVLQNKVNNFGLNDISDLVLQTFKIANANNE